MYTESKLNKIENKIQVSLCKYMVIWTPNLSYFTLVKLHANIFLGGYMHSGISKEMVVVEEEEEEKIT